MGRHFSCAGFAPAGHGVACTMTWNASPPTWLEIVAGGGLRIAPHVADLLLACPVDVPDVVEVVFDCRSIGHAFDDGLDRDTRVRTEGSDRAAGTVDKQLRRSFDEDNTNGSTGGTIRGRTGIPSPMVRVRHCGSCR